MQIYELTARQSVNEISWDSIKKGAKNVGKALVQAPVKALGNKVGVDLIGNEKTKSATELMYDMQKYFGFAKQQLYQGMPENIIMSELIGKYGANKEQAEKALEAAQQQLQTGSQASSQSGSNAFDTMANQLGQAGATPSATTTPSAPAPANPAVPNTTYQMPTGMQTTSNAKTTMAAGNGSYQVPGRVIPPSPYTAPGQVPAQSTQTTPAQSTTPASTAPVKQEPIRIGGQKIRPSDPLYAKLQKQIAQQQPTAVAESLTWSRNFDPSRTLLKKIRQL